MKMATKFRRRMRSVSNNGGGRGVGRRQTLQGDGPDLITLNKMDAMLRRVENVLSSRKEWLTGDDGSDPRRNINDECGYPTTNSMTPWKYQMLFDRDPIAARVVEFMAKEAWQVTPKVYEKERNASVTAFERSWDEVGSALRSEGGQDWYKDESGSPIWEVLLRANILSGIGQFGVILYGLDDGLSFSSPVPGFEEVGSVPTDFERDGNGNPVMLPGQVKGLAPPRPKAIANKSYSTFVANGSFPRYELTINETMTQGRKLGYMQVYPEAMALPVRFESNKRSPRWGMPTMYQITFNDPSQQYQGIGLPLATEYVHWTRLQHICDTVHTAGSSRAFAIQRMRPMLNHLLALQKIYHGGAEGYWKAVFSYLFLETHPQLGGDVDVDVDSLQDMMEEMINGLQRYGFLTGMGAKSVAPSVADPTSQVNVNLQAICIKGGWPQRVFMGSERGELASSQDDAAWNDRVKQYEHGYITPGIIRPCVNRLIQYGVLARPEKFKIWWPDITSQSDQEKAQVASTITQCLSTYVNGGVGNALSMFDYLTRVLKWEEAEAKTVIDTIMAEAQDAAGYDDHVGEAHDLSGQGWEFDEQLDEGQEQDWQEDWAEDDWTGDEDVVTEEEATFVPDEAKEGESEDAQQSPDETAAINPPAEEEEKGAEKKAVQS